MKQAGLARLGRCPSQCERSEPGFGDLSNPKTLFKSKFICILRFWYLSVMVLNLSAMVPNLTVMVFNLSVMVLNLSRSY